MLIGAIDDAVSGPRISPYRGFRGSSGAGKDWTWKEAAAFIIISPDNPISISYRSIPHLPSDLGVKTRGLVEIPGKRRPDDHTSGLLRASWRFFARSS